VKYLLIILLLSGCAGGIVQIDSSAGGATGVIVDRLDHFYYVATAGHVAAFLPELSIDGHIAHVFSDTLWPDVAILVFYSEQTYRVYSIAQPRVGEQCRLIGYPSLMFRRIRLEQWGHISGHAQGYAIFNTGGMPGFSGGPVLNKWGQVIGICSHCPNTREGPWETIMLGPDGRSIKDALRKAQE